jgi:hypothetical protein
VDHVTRRKPASASDRRPAGLASAELAALQQKLRARQDKIVAELVEPLDEARRT